MVEFLRGLGPQLKKLYKLTATTLVRIMALRERCLRLPLQVFPEILPDWVESWTTDEKALQLLGMAMHFLDVEVQRVQNEGRELTLEELEALGKHLRLIRASLYIFQEGKQVTEKFLMPGSRHGDVLAIRAPRINQEARKAAAQRILKEHLGGKPINYKLYSARSKEFTMLFQEKNFEERALASIFLAADEIGEKTLAELEERSTLFASRVSYKMAEDIWGPKFWQRHRNEPLDEGHHEFADDPDRIFPAEAKLQLEAIYSYLTPLEIEIIEATASGFTMVELAAELGITPGCARVILHRARKKTEPLR